MGFRRILAIGVMSLILGNSVSFANIEELFTSADYWDIKSRKQNDPTTIAHLLLLFPDDRDLKIRKLLMMYFSDSAPIDSSDADLPFEEISAQDLLSQLPEETISEILSYLKSEDLLQVNQVSHLFHRLAPEFRLKCALREQKLIHLSNLRLNNTQMLWVLKNANPDRLIALNLSGNQLQFQNVRWIDELKRFKQLAGINFGAAAQYSFENLKAIKTTFKNYNIYWNSEKELISNVSK
jgi:hypothetical protein